MSECDPDEILSGTVDRIGDGGGSVSEVRGPELRWRQSAVLRGRERGQHWHREA